VAAQSRKAFTNDLPEVAIYSKYHMMNGRKVLEEHRDPKSLTRRNIMSLMPMPPGQLSPKKSLKVYTFPKLFGR